MTDFIYDIETYPNMFSIGARNIVTRDMFGFEISWRKNELEQFIAFLSWMRSQDHRMVGFNNIGFDYPVVHFIIENQENVTVLDIFRKADSIINCEFNDRFSHIIWYNDRHIRQLDLFKIHHFDNPAKSTGLKVLEFNMRSETIQDLPFEPGTCLTWDQCDDLIKYMWKDIDETEKFYHESREKIEFREKLTHTYNRDFMNHSDVKIGVDYFLMELEKQIPGYNKKTQTKRDRIRVYDILFPYIRFNHPEFIRVHNWFKQQVITDTKKAFTDIDCTIDGFKFVFGTGGIHGSVDSSIIEADDDHVIIDIDVSSYYPNLAIQNNLYPAHLGQNFCTIYKEVYEQRKQFKKKSAENEMLKLALNGVYGNSNNQYSPFYDPQYTMSITINGQLLLCMLAESLMLDNMVKMIQVNTDGVTVQCHKSAVDRLMQRCDQWEQLTGLTLEYASYSKMFIRDVNNYTAVYTDGRIKRKGAYDYELEWHKDHSARIVPKAVEKHLVYGEDLRNVIETHDDIHDFMLRTKVPRSSRLVWVDYDRKDHQIQNTSRYYISVMGGDLVKIMPPLKGKTEDRRIGVNAGWKVSICNDMKNCNPDDIEHEWYIKEAEKLVEPLRK